MKKCRNCKWREPFSHACMNGDSPNRADFMCDDMECEAWEGKTCADCQYHNYTKMCDNERSDYCAEFTENNDGCEEWELNA